MPKFAANLSMMFTEWEFLDRFAAAADAGFTAVEFLFPYDHPPEMLAQRISDNHLTPVLFNLPPGDWANNDRGLAALPNRRGEFQASISKAIDYAQLLGVNQLHMMAGIADWEDQQALVSYKKSLIYASEAFEEASLTLLIEPLNPRDMPGYFLSDFNLAIGLIRELGLPNLRLQYDIYHRQILHGDVMTSLTDLLPIIGHIQIASVPKRHEPGTGELNDALILSHLDAIGYAGYVGCEYRPANGTITGLTWMDAI